MSRRHQSLRLVPERFDDEGSSGNKATGVDKPLPPKRKPADVTDEDEEIVDELDE